MKEDKEYDVVIIGSGLGGLLCGHILSEEGYSVCILEKNKQLGGSLQTFVRDRVIFDTGIHYIGGLTEGQPLYQYFKYLKIIDKLKIQKLSEDGFDKFGFTNDPNVYSHAQGYDKFIETLAGYFPEERQGIINYCESVKTFCKKFPLYNLSGIESEMSLEEMSFLQVNAKEHIQSFTSNVKLQNVLGASNSLYAGVGDKSPFYIHALIVNSYIESAYRCVDGGSQITRILTKSIFQNNGVILKHAEVKQMVMNETQLDHLILTDGRQIKGKKFISNIHPALILDMLHTDKIRNAYRNRINGLENTISVFIVNVVLKKNTFKYRNYNYYHCEDVDVWSTAYYSEENWPKGYGMFFSASSKSEEYAEGITLMSYMRFDEMLPWKDTCNTVDHNDERGESYEKFKKAKAEKLIEYACRQFPDLKESIKSYYSSTPLTYRDYIGTKDGSLYGILKDHSDPLRSFISTKTKVPNLFFTGQNLNIHGVYGVTVSAIKTCFEFIDPAYLFNKIKNA